MTTTHPLDRLSVESLLRRERDDAIDDLNVALDEIDRLNVYLETQQNGELDGR